MTKKYMFTAIVFVLWIVGFYLATGFTGGDLLGVLASAPLGSMLLGILLYFLAIGSGIFTLRRCLKYVGINAPLKGIGKAWIFGSFVDNIAPTVTPVGEATMAYFLEKFYRISYTKSLAAIGMYVSAWGLSVSLFSVVSVLLAYFFVGIPSSVLPIVVIVVGIFTVFAIGWLLLLTKKDIVKRIVCKIVMLYNIINIKIRRKKLTVEKCVFDVEFERSYNTLDVVLKNKKHILGSVIILLIPQLAHILCIYTLLLGFGIQVSFLQVLTIQIVATVIGLISLIPSGLGVYEGASIGGLSLTLGIPESASFGAIFLYRLIFVWGTNLIGGLVGIVQGVEEDTKILKK